MFRTMTMACVATLGILGWTAAPTEAAPFHSHRPMDVQYRSPFWKEQVFTCPIEANAFERERLSKGFEVRRILYGNLIHVGFRMPYWTTFQTVDGHHHAHDVERFLESRGYEARVLHR